MRDAKTGRLDTKLVRATELAVQQLAPNAPSKTTHYRRPREGRLVGLRISVADCVQHGDVGQTELAPHRFGVGDGRGAEHLARIHK